MIQSPSKYLSRNFLRGLINNRNLSESGKEYCEQEVRDLLNEKESRLALRDYAEEMKQMNEREQMRIVMNFQDSLIKPESRARDLRGAPRRSEAHSRSEKKLSMRYAPGSITTFDLHNSTPKEIVSEHQEKTPAGGLLSIAKTMIMPYSGSPSLIPNKKTPTQKSARSLTMSKAQLQKETERLQKRYDDHHVTINPDRPKGYFAKELEEVSQFINTNLKQLKEEHESY